MDFFLQEVDFSLQEAGRVSFSFDLIAVSAKEAKLLKAESKTSHFILKEKLYKLA